MTLYSDASGKTVAVKTDVPQVRSVHQEESAEESLHRRAEQVLCDIATTDLSVAASSGTEAWKFYVKTGRLIANDGAHDTH